MTDGDAARPDVVVVGGGLVGICTALHLQRTGRRVMVVERGQPGGEASSHNAGIFSLGNCVPTATPAVVRGIPRMLVDPLSPLAIRWRYLPRLAPWLVRFLWAARPARVESASTALKDLIDHAVASYQPLLADGIDSDSPGRLHPTGHLLAFRTDRSFAAARADVALRSRRGIDFRLLDGAGLAALDPLLAGRFRRGLYYPDAPFTQAPRAFAGQLASRFVAGGGVLHRAEVRSFRVANGQVQAVETTGGPVPAGSVVIAAGAWSRRLLRQLGSDVPLDTERGYGVHLPDPGLPLRLPVISADHHFVLTPAGGPTSADGGLRLAGTDELAGLAAPPNFARADRLIEAARTIFPELRTGGATRWMNFRPSLPDSLPVIGRAPRQSNVYLAFGHGHLGLTLAAITGELVAQLLDGTEPRVDLTPFRPTRFVHWGRRR